MIDYPALHRRDTIRWQKSHVRERLLVRTSFEAEGQWARLRKWHQEALPRSDLNCLQTPHSVAQILFFGNLLENIALRGENQRACVWRDAIEQRAVRRGQNKRIVPSPHESDGVSAARLAKHHRYGFTQTMIAGAPLGNDRKQRFSIDLGVAGQARMVAPKIGIVDHYAVV